MILFLWDVVISLFTSRSRLSTTLRMKALETIVGKGENAGNHHFLLFPRCFLTFPKQISSFELHFDLSSANAFNLDKFKNFSFGKESICQQMCHWKLKTFADNKIKETAKLKSVLQRVEKN